MGRSGTGLPATPGFHEAKLLSTFITSNKNSEGAITSADISPDGQQVVLLSKKFIWFFYEFTDNNFLSGQVKKLALPDKHQYEGIVFEDECHIFLCNERNDKNETQLEKFSLCQ